MNFTKLTKEEQLTILANVAEDKGIVDNAVEKDYWVSMVLRAIFSLPYAAAFVLTGTARAVGKNRTPLAVTLCVFVWPCIFIPGTKAMLVEGQDFTATVAANTELSGAQ